MSHYSAHLGYQYTEVPLEARFHAAAAAGFTVVEHPAPYAMGVAAFGAAARAAGVGIAQIAAPSGDAAKGEKGFACLPERADAFAASLEEGIAAASTLDARYLHIMSGTAPGPLEAAQARWTETYVARIAEAADRAAAAGIAILIEPIDDGAMPGYFMNDPWFARDVLRRIARPNAFMLLDVFHAHNRGIDPVAFWRAAGDLVGHVHVADAPGRHEPGTGVIDYGAFFDELARTAYRGLVGCEYKPLGDTVAGLAFREAYA